LRASRAKEKPNDIKSDVTVAPGRAHSIDVTAYVVAVGLAAVAAMFSIKGMLQLFPGAPLLIVAMATMMESAKLVTAGWLARRWRVTACCWPVVLVVLVAGLALISQVRLRRLSSLVQPPPRRLVSGHA
jgi:hypothetical protein